MSYLVLARKYRPGRFDDLVGQEHVARTLTNAIALERVHHAYLFTGARGVGKTSAARILAKALCCVQGPTATPCGVCDFCGEIASGQSVDVLEIDGASNTGVDDVRTLREGVRYLPSKGRKKVYIIDEVHMLSTSAFNALLKTLEEPPAHVVFVFATTEVHKIPSTIMSRCQRFDFKLVPTARLTEHLAAILVKESVSCEPDALRLLARQAAGSVRDALSLLDQVIAYVGDAPITAELVAEVLGIADRAFLHALAEAVLARDVASAMRVVSQAVDRGIDLGQIARAFLAHLHDLEMVALLPDPSGVVDATADELTLARALAGKAPRGLLGALFDRWARAVEESGKSPAPRLVLEMALVDLCFAEPLLPLGDLLPRLEELEGRLGEEGGGRGGPRPPERGGPGRSSPPSRGGGAVGPSSSAVGANPEGRTAAPVAVAPVAVAPAPVSVGVSAPAPMPAVGSLPGAGAGGEGGEGRGGGTAVAASSGVTFTGAAVAAPTAVALVGGNGSAAPTGRDPAALWRRVRESFGDRLLLAAALDHGEVMEWDAGRLVLSLPDKLRADQVEKYRKDVERSLATVVGAPMQLVVRQGATSATAVLRSEVGREADAVLADQRRREAEARQHPMIKKAQELFGVSAREIKTL